MKRSVLFVSVFLQRFFPIRFRLLLLAGGLMLAMKSNAQPGAGTTLKGQVIMPASSTRQVIRRGDAYRNRGGEVRTGSRISLEEANHPDRNVIVILYPRDREAQWSPSPNALLLQTEKTFFPRVLPVTRGSTVVIENADDFYHNVFSITPGARFNIGRRPPGNRQTQRVDKAGEVRVFCDIHPQMNAVILSLETPYFTRVDEKGQYRLEGLPEGAYRFEIYHPEAGTLKGTLSLNGRGETEKQFDLRELARP